jgi:large subunit ribosomal protein L30
MTGTITKPKALRITLKKSGIGRSRKQRETLYGLGLTYTGKTVLRSDSVALRGMIRKVAHLIEVHENGS